MQFDMVTVPNSTDYYAVAIPIDATLGALDFILSVTILVLYLTNSGWKRSTSFVFMNIAFVDLVNSINTVFMCYLMAHPGTKKIFYSAFFFQAMVLNTSLYLVLLLGIMRLVALTRPFEFASLVKNWVVVALCAIIWIGSGIDCYLRYDWREYRRYNVYLTGVILRIVMIAITNVTGISTIGLLLKKQLSKQEFEEDKTKMKLRRSASFTASLLSVTYLVCHSYYLYVLLVWAVPGTCKKANKTARPWLYFTACGPESLSMGHISLLLQSIATNLIILNQHTLRCQLVRVSSTISSIIFTSQSERENSSVKLSSVARSSIARNSIKSNETSLLRPTK